MHATREIFRLAARDFLYERRLSLCYVLALTAVLAPLLILFGLKFGLVDTLARRLVESPVNREVIAVGSHRYDAAWFERIAARSDVAFVIPSTRRIAASLSQLQNPATGAVVRAVQMVPTGAGEPLLHLPRSPSSAAAKVTEDAFAKIPEGVTELMLSASAAQRLGVSSGERVLARIDRTAAGRDEGVVWEVTVTGVLRPEVLTEEAALVPLELLVATEDYRDGVAVPALGWSGVPPSTAARQFARFRLYAVSINDVARLEADLTAEGIDVRSQLTEIAAMQALDRNLTRVFWLIAGIGTLGFLASLAANLLANVERKRRELSILRLIGFPTASLMLFPITQAALIALFGALAAVLVYLPVTLTLNDWFTLSLQPGESICRLLPIHLALALGTTLLGAMTAAAWAGWRAARIAPAEGVRDV
ncbi:lipoprotein ABC transporter permease [Chromatium okenii]|uniref:FtsX-like permease family protein n=1 Tax=Chromatium okenii TaxID=61644 RepID=UPI0019065746|nr:FtsX-like permease family protein [Chromatium okenii]MBK1642384.1 lipoprotein ABC transporter permease [Chromatium okenii]